MTISAKRQFLSNMLRRLFAFLILGGLIAICSCEPVNRKHLPIASETIECADNEDDGSACGQTNETIDASLQNHEDQPPTDRKVRQKSLDDDMTNQGKIFCSDLLNFIKLFDFIIIIHYYLENTASNIQFIDVKKEKIDEVNNIFHKYGS